MERGTGISHSLFSLTTDEARTRHVVRRLVRADVDVAGLHGDRRYLVDHVTHAHVVVLALVVALLLAADHVDEAAFAVLVAAAVAIVAQVDVAAAQRVAEVLQSAQLYQ